MEEIEIYDVPVVQPEESSIPNETKKTLLEQFTKKQIVETKKIPQDDSCSSDDECQSKHSCCVKRRKIQAALSEDSDSEEEPPKESERKSQNKYPKPKRVEVQRKYHSDSEEENTKAKRVDVVNVRTYRGDSKFNNQPFKNSKWVGQRKKFILCVLPQTKEIYTAIEDCLESSNVEYFHPESDNSKFADYMKNTIDRTSKKVMVLHPQQECIDALKSRLEVRFLYIESGNVLNPRRGAFIYRGEKDKNGLRAKIENSCC